MDNTLGAQIISLPQITKSLNNNNPDDEILVFDVKNFMAGRDVLPIRMDALLIGICTRGEGEIGIDLNSYQIKKDSMIVLDSRNYLWKASLSEDFESMILICSKDISEYLLPTFVDVLPLLLHHKVAPVNNLTDKEAQRVLQYFVFLQTTIMEGPSKFHRKKVMALFQSLLYELLDIRLRYMERITKPRSRKEEIMARFLIMVGEKFRESREVAYYAEKLNITPKHLSTAVKDISGRPAGDWIENYVVMEAKILLKTTDMTIQQIADHLNFANQSFFGKYFKKASGVSPSEYRKA